jgi:hypothetical protein
VTVSLLHQFHNPQPDGPDTTITRPSDWNAQHQLTGSPNVVLGFDAGGLAGEIALPIGALLVGQSGPPTPLLVGSNGQVLTVSGGVPTWTTPFELVLTANLDVYMAPAPTGNDANSGLSAGTPIATLGRYNQILRSISGNGFQVTLHVANGTYNDGINIIGPYNNISYINIFGGSGAVIYNNISPSGSPPVNTNPNWPYPIATIYVAVQSVQVGGGITLQSDNTQAINVDTGGFVNISNTYPLGQPNINFNNCAGCIWAYNGGKCIMQGAIGVNGTDYAGELFNALVTGQIEWWGISGGSVMSFPNSPVMHGNKVGFAAQSCGTFQTEEEQGPVSFSGYFIGYGFDCFGGQMYTNGRSERFFPGTFDGTVESSGAYY